MPVDWIADDVRRAMENSPPPQVVPMESSETAPAKPAAPAKAQPRGESGGNINLMRWAAMLAPNNPAVQARYAQMQQQQGLQQIGDAIMQSQSLWDQGKHQDAMQAFDTAMASPALRTNPQLFMQALKHRVEMGKQFVQTQKFQALAAELSPEGIGPQDFLKLAMKHGLDAEFAAKMAPIFGKKDATIMKGDHGEFIVFDGQGNVKQVIGPVTGLRKDAFSANDHDNVRRASQELGFGATYMDAWETATKAQNGDQNALAVMTRASQMKNVGAEQKISGELAVKLGRAKVPIPPDGLLTSLPKGWEQKVAQAEDVKVERETRMRGDVATRELVDREAAIRGMRLMVETMPNQVAVDPNTGERLSAALTTRQAEEKAVRGEIKIISHKDADLIGYANRALAIVAQSRDVMPKVLAAAKNDKVKPFANIKAFMEYAAKKHFMSNYDIGVWEAFTHALQIEAARVESPSGQGIASLLQTAVHQQVPSTVWDNVSSATGKFDGLEANIANLRNEKLGKPLMTPYDLRKMREAASAARGQIDPDTLGDALSIMKGKKKK